MSKKKTNHDRSRHTFYLEENGFIFKCTENDGVFSLRLFLLNPDDNLYHLIKFSEPGSIYVIPKYISNVQFSEDDGNFAKCIEDAMNFCADSAMNFKRMADMMEQAGKKLAGILINDGVDEDD